LIHSQYTIAVQLIPPILFDKINLYNDKSNDNNDNDNDNDNNSKPLPDSLIEYLEDISEFFNILEISHKNEKIPRPLQINIYPNNFIFIPRDWGFRFLVIKEYEEQTRDGLVEFFVYKTIFSKLLN
jgi:hypothetical protein